MPHTPSEGLKVIFFLITITLLISSYTVTITTIMQYHDIPITND